MRSAPDPSTYDERLWPGPLGWFLVLGFGLLMTISVWPVRPAAALVTGGLAVVGGVVAAVLSSPRVRVADGELRAAAAHIDVAWLGAGTALDREGVRRAMGPGSDARAFVVLRSWLPGAVAVEVTDPHDATPTWLISSRHPDRLLAAIRAAQQAQAAHSEQIG